AAGPTSGYVLRERAECIARGARIGDDAREGRRRPAPVAFRIVPLPIVQQHDSAGAEPSAHAPPDLARRYVWIRVPHPEGPAEDRVSQPARSGRNERIAVAVRRAEGT